MLTTDNRRELEELGVTVVRDVISQEDCDRHQAYFRQWLSKFPEGKFPQSKNSLVQRYRSGHLQPAWEVRLAAKATFAQVWGTDKLLTSMDAIAIGRPPEGGQEEFWTRNQNWLHVDQNADRVGLHAYQGSVFLEDCEEDDWTFEVIKGSHKYFDDFMKRTEQYKCFSLKKHDIEWFDKKGCERIRVPCPKGGMILWDSRLFHANARPLEGRSNPGRWRYVVFVCMTPAAWATQGDLEKKRKAYETLQITTHWPSQEIKLFSTRIGKNQVRDFETLEELPEVAKSDEAQRLAGVLPYDKDGEKQPDLPKWQKKGWDEAKEDFTFKNPRGGTKGASATRRSYRT